MMNIIYLLQERQRKKETYDSIGSLNINYINICL